MSQGSTKTDPLRYAALIAHQLQSPLNGVSAHLMSLLGEYAGPVVPRQRVLLEKAQDRCAEAIAAIRRMLTIVHTMDDPTEAVGASEVVRLVHRAESRYQHEAAKQHIAFSRHIDVDRAWVPLQEAVLEEVLHALVTNALKYTPAHGRVRVGVESREGGEHVRLTVADSGIGIPEPERSKVFEPFYRSGAAKSSARPGVGLGLALVKTAVGAVGGIVTIASSDLGGTE
ncbi:MAG: HAMP domain-containing histidine kinase, partial [bacterium]|nr:HAMP domain-containing histidine kinase [bacterium]